MTSRPSPDGSGHAPAEPVPLPFEAHANDDIVLAERSVLRHRWPNQHDLDSDDDQVIWTEDAAAWADFDDLEDAILPHGAADDDWHSPPVL